MSLFCFEMRRNESTYREEVLNVPQPTQIRQNTEILKLL